jgi:hypothetical protein
LYGDAHVLQPLKLLPPHCDHCDEVQPPLLAVDEVAGAGVVVVDEALLVEVTSVVEDETGVLVELLLSPPPTGAPIWIALANISPRLIAMPTLSRRPRSLTRTSD